MAEVETQNMALSDILGMLLDLLAAELKHREPLIRRPIMPSVGPLQRVGKTLKPLRGGK